MGDLETAQDIVRAAPENEAPVKWKSLGDRALAVWRFELAREAFEKAGDLSALMLLLLAIGDKDGLNKLAVQAGMFFSVHCSVSIDASSPLLCSGKGAKQPRLCFFLPNR
jgi:hypothetical protein